MPITRRRLLRATGVAAGAAATSTLLPRTPSASAAGQPAAQSIDAPTDVDYTFYVGQSLACGAGDGPALLTTPKYPDTVQYFDPTGAVQGLVSGYYPRYTDREYPATSFGYTVYEGNSVPLIVNLHAKGGGSYDELRKGGSSGKYEEAIDTYRAGVAANPDKKYTARTMHIVHGEADDIPRNDYANDLLEWRSDFDADMAAIDGHTEPLQAIFCQVNRRWSLPLLKGSAFGQVVAHRNSPFHHLVGAKYQLPYKPDGTFHMVSVGYLYLGEMHARTEKVVRSGQTWNPLMPQRVSFSGQVITARFFVPTPPLVWDTTQVPLQPNYGFTVKDSSSSNVPITDVSITSPNTVRITVDRPLGAKPRLRYGQTITTTGNLRDSDPLVSFYDGFPLANWCVWFDDAMKQTA